MMLLKNLRDSIAVPRTSRGDYKLAESLLKAIRDHAVLGTPAGRERFQQGLGELNRRMVGTDDEEELIMIAGAAHQALRQFESETNAYWQNQTTELQAIVTTMTTALTEFAERNSQSAGRLVELEHSLEKISSIEDLREIRHKIQECVATLRAEHQSHRETQHLLAQTLPARGSRTGDDPVTGLLSRQAAEEAIAREMEGSRNACLALFVIHRIQQVNSRYGHAVGDSMLNTFLQHLAANLRPVDQLFRWSGPAFLALVRRGQHLDTVAVEMRRIASHKVDIELEIRDRSIMVPLSASVSVIGLNRTITLQAVCTELEQFTASHMQR
jgi:diguanylate cyclase (GGDEF)-like protein